MKKTLLFFVLLLVLLLSSCNNFKGYSNQVTKTEFDESLNAKIESFFENVDRDFIIKNDQEEITKYIDTKFKKLQTYNCKKEYKYDFDNSIIVYDSNEKNYYKSSDEDYKSELIMKHHTQLYDGNTYVIYPTDYGYVHNENFFDYRLNSILSSLKSLIFTYSSDVFYENLEFYIDGDIYTAIFEEKKSDDEFIKYIKQIILKENSIEYKLFLEKQYIVSNFGEVIESDTMNDQWLFSFEKVKIKPIDIKKMVYFDEV